MTSNEPKKYEERKNFELFALRWFRKDVVGKQFPNEKIIIDVIFLHKNT